MKKELSNEKMVVIGSYLKDMIYMFHETEDKAYMNAIDFIIMIFTSLYECVIKIENNKVFINNEEIKKTNYNVKETDLTEYETKVIRNKLYILIKSYNDYHEKSICIADKQAKEYAMICEHTYSLTLANVLRLLNNLYKFDLKVNINVDDFYTSFILNGDKTEMVY